MDNESEKKPDEIVSEGDLRKLISERGDFFGSEFDSDREQRGLTVMISACNLKECLKAFRDLSYDMVAWYSEKDKSRLYDGTYSDEQINQATQLQRSICGLSDMFAQIIVNHREFDKDYASRNIYFDSEVVSLRSENARLKLENENLKLRVRDLEEKAER